MTRSKKSQEPLTVRQSNALKTKKKIYKAAQQLFEKNGFEKVSVDSIVERAGVSKGSFYVHFESKNSLINALIVENVSKLDLDYKMYFDSFPSDTKASHLLISFAEKIVEIIVGTLGYDIIKTVYGALFHQTIEIAGILNYDRDVYKMFNTILTLGIEQGEFRPDIDIDSLTQHCVMTIRGMIYEWCIRYPNFALQEEVRKHFEILLTGVKKH